VTVILSCLPGLLADDSSTKPLRDFLKSTLPRACWKLGHNRGLRANVESDMRARFDELFARSRPQDQSRGWSLGGLYAGSWPSARPTSPLLITLGSPFAGSPASTHACRPMNGVGNRIDTPSS